MRNTIIAILAFAAAATAQARPFFHRPVINPVPAVENTCVYNLEKETERYDYNRRRWVVANDLVESFTEFGRRACIRAEEACFRRMVREQEFNYWDKFTCTKEFSSRPPRPRRSCGFQIERARGSGILLPQVFSATGPGACGIAQDQCEREIKVRISQGQTHLRNAACVQTSGNLPGPGRPQPVLVPASCTAAQFFYSNRGTRTRTALAPFTQTERARNFQVAYDLACESALRLCEAATASGPRFGCEVID